MPLGNVSSPNVHDTLVASAARTASDSSTALLGFAAAENLVIQLEITAASGTTPTLDVIIQDTVDGGTNYHAIATFTQKVTTGIFVERFQGAFSDQIRARWVIGGTTPSFTFSVKTFADA